MKVYMVKDLYDGEVMGCYESLSLALEHMNEHEAVREMEVIEEPKRQPEVIVVYEKSNPMMRMVD